jgi:alkylation response protein AidB-like acyl-CoA dehydrogenase
MEIGLSDDQRLLAESARDVLAEHSPASLTRSSYDDPEAWRPLWQTIVELGWTGVVASEADPDEVKNLVALVEASGAATVCAPFLSTVGLAAGALRAARPAAGALLDEIADGLTATLLTSPSASRLPGPCLSLDNGRVTGRVRQVRDIARADLAVGLAEDSIGTIQLVAFRLADANVSALEAVDPSQPVGSVMIGVAPELAVPVDVDDIIAVPLTASAAELVGVAGAALAMSVAYAKTREQFGQPIGGFQAIKHRLADVFVGLERARSLTYAAAAAASGGEGSMIRSAYLAKAAANDAALAAIRACVSVHGAIAQTWEHDAHLLVRRTWQSAALLGETEALYRAAAQG